MLNKSLLYGDDVNSPPNSCKDAAAASKNMEYMAPEEPPITASATPPRSLKSLMGCRKFSSDKQSVSTDSAPRRSVAPQSPSPP